MVSIIQLLLEVSIDQLRTQWVETGKMKPEIFDRICRAVNNNSNWATWLVKRVSQGYVAEEDIEQWTDYMNTFERYKARFQTKDINTLKSPEQIADFAHECVMVQQAADERIANSGGEKVKGSKEERKREVDRFRLPDYTNSVTGEKFEVFKLPKESGKENQKYAIELGTGTTWCTASRGTSNFYSHYIPKGPLYIFISKNDPSEKYQIHVESDQFKDKKDREVDYCQDKYLDFYRYLQRVDNIHLSDKARQEFLRRKILSDAGKYPAEPEKYALDFKVKPGETWYCFDEGKVDPVAFVSTVAEILDLDFEKAADLIISKKSPLLLTSDGYFAQIRHRRQPEEVYDIVSSAGGNYYSDMTPEQFVVFKRMLSSLGLVFDNAKIETLFDTNLPSLDTFKVGTLDNYPVYYFNTAKGPTVRALIELKTKSPECFARSGDICFFFDPAGKYVVLTLNTSYLTYGNYIKTSTDFQKLVECISQISRQLDIKIPLRDFQSFARKFLELEQRLDAEQQLLEGVFKIDISGISFNERELDEFQYSFDHRSPIITVMHLIARVKPDNLYYVKSNNYFIYTKNGSAYLTEKDSYLTCTVVSRLPQKASTVAEILTKLKLDLPDFLQVALEKAQQKKNGTLALTVPELMRSREADFKSCDISKVRHREVNGLEGTWQDFGKNIIRSSSGWGLPMQHDINANHWITRIVLYWNSNGRDWNLFCQMKDQDGNVRKIYERTGGGMGVTWHVQDVNQLQEQFNGTGYTKLMLEYM